MKRVTLQWGVLLLVCLLCGFCFSQSQPNTQAQPSPSKAFSSDTVPRLIRFSGTMRDASGTPKSGSVDMTFALYDAPTGGALLWSEKVTVQCNEEGHYTVLLGSTQPEGLPMEVFASRQARWLGITPEVEGKERERVQLTSTPYALKAADADTLGGKPASAFMLSPSEGAESAQPVGANSAGTSNASSKASGPTNITGTGTKNFIPLWTSTTNLGNSVIFQNSSQNIGVGVTSPNAKLVVKGNVINTRIGDPACGTNFAGLGFGNGALSCTNYSIIGDGTDTYINTASSTGLIDFRQANVPVMTLGPADIFTGEPFARIFGTTFMGDDTTSFDTEQGKLFVGNSDQKNPQSGTIQADFTANFAMSAAILGDNTSAQSSGVEGFAEGSAYSMGVSGVAFSGGSTNAGVMGENLGDGIGVVAINQGGPSQPALVAVSPNAGILQPVLQVTGNTLGSPSCIIDSQADLICAGFKAAVVPVDRGQRQVTLYAVESPENWFEDFGSAKLTNGTAIVMLEPTFVQTVNTGMDYHVFLTPEDDCKGLYVKQKTATSFEVHEMAGGKSSVTFDYRIVARRRGYEQTRMGDETAIWTQLKQTRDRVMELKVAQPHHANKKALASVRAPR
jgi:hypothetical protein